MSMLGQISKMLAKFASILQIYPKNIDKPSADKYNNLRYVSDVYRLNLRRL